MTLDQIKFCQQLFKQAVFEGSEFLHRTQPLSCCDKESGEEFGFELFDRTNYRPVLTTKEKVLASSSSGTG